jgi:hypothetical protein
MWRDENRTNSGWAERSYRDADVPTRPMGKLSIIQIAINRINKP